MSAVLGVLVGILAVAGAFGFIIFIHELGHFLTARAVDIRCPQFAIGFGPSLFSFRWRGTNFAVRALPLGGYVLMNGEEPGSRTDDPWAKAVQYYLGTANFPATPASLLKIMEETPEEERNEVWREVYEQVHFARAEEFPTLQSVEGNFHDRSIPARILVISGGVLMNFAATILIMWCLGPFVGQGSFFRDWSPVVSQSFEGNPAHDAGLTGGDLILAVDGKPTGTFLEAFHAIGAFKGESFSLKLRDLDGVEKTVDIRPLLRVGREAYLVGDDGKLKIHSSKNEELVGKAVLSPNRTELLAQLATIEVPKGDDEKKVTYQVELEGEKEPTKFELPSGFTGARGQIGVLFGVSDILFEKELTGRVSEVQSGSPAEVAGVKVGDELLDVGGLALVSNNGLVFGHMADRAVSIVSQVEAIETLELGVLRNGEYQTLKLEEKPPSLEALGITLAPVTKGDLAQAPFKMIGQMLAMPYRILQMWLSKQATGKEIVQSMQGPLGIMQLLYALRDNGILEFMFFMALLNAAIGAFNLLPFPALDGARLVFLVLAGLRGKPIDPDKEAKVHLLGLAVLLCFVVVVTFGDIKRLFSAQLFVL